VSLGIVEGVVFEISKLLVTVFDEMEYRSARRASLKAARRPANTLKPLQEQSSRSERQHKAWGASPRIRSQNIVEPVKTGDSRKNCRLSPAFAGSDLFIGALTWGLRPRLYAYDCYRRLRKQHESFTAVFGL